MPEEDQDDRSELERQVEAARERSREEESKRLAAEERIRQLETERQEAASEHNPDKEELARLKTELETAHEKLKIYEVSPEPEEPTADEPQVITRRVRRYGKWRDEEVRTT